MPTTNPARVLAALRWRIAVHDRLFDRLYPERLRRLSSVHWTPVSVALRAAAWLAPEAGARVLDIGCGAGKLCCIGAASRGGTWHGVDRDPALVQAAIAAATLLDLQASTTFTTGEMEVVDWSSFDSLYFYNPFAAILFGPAPFPKSVRWTMLTEQIARTEAHLAELAIGTRVVTYEGFGGDMPDGYVLTQVELIRDGQLALWVKQRSRRRVRSSSGSGQTAAGAGQRVTCSASSTS
ncbi:MAG: methyltransferase domain-containing protein [Myxococcales bacterium]|nr:methyltransferase domain-containing protein [Myxococcales bacterium]